MVPYGSTYMKTIGNNVNIFACLTLTVNVDIDITNKRRSIALPIASYLAERTIWWVKDEIHCNTFITSLTDEINPSEKKKHT